MSERRRAAALLLGILALAAAPARAATYFAGAAGCSDTGPGNQKQPFCTLAAASAALKPGDTLNLLEGTFKERLTLSVVGSAQSPVVIQAAEGASVALDGKGIAIPEDAGLVTLKGARYVTLRGFAIRESARFCLFAIDGATLRFENLSIEGCDHGGLIAANSTGVTIVDSEIAATARLPAAVHEAVTLTNVDGFSVSGCFVHDGGKEGIDAKDGSRNGKIFKNTVAVMGAAGVYLNHATAVEVYENEIRQNTEGGIVLSTGDGAAGALVTSRNSIYRNLVWNNGLDGLHFWIEKPGEMRENKVYNNDFFGNAHHGILLPDVDQGCKENVIRNNIVVQNPFGGIGGQTANSLNTISHNLFFKPGTAVGTNAVTGDPLLANPTAGSFQLLAGSPAIDAGYEMGLPKIGAAPDIGAFEFGVPLIPDAGVPDLFPSVPDAGGAGGAEEGCKCQAGGRDLLGGGALALVCVIALAWRRRAGLRRG